MNIGFVGLGIMGKPMALNLIKGGHTLFLNSRSGVPKELTDAGGTACASPKEVAQKADIIITMVPDTPDVEKVLFGANGIAEGLSKGKTVVDMSSISPIETKCIAKRINDLGCDYVDAPVSGGEVGAKNAALTIMVGAPQAAFDRVKPIFELMGKNITLVGGNGDGQTCKVCNQIIVALNIEAVSEALVFASKAGADPAKRIQTAFRRVTGRTPEPRELLVLTGLAAKQLDRYRRDEKAARALLAIGEAPVAKDLPAAELAAWTNVATVLLNMDEAITKE